MLEFGFSKKNHFNEKCTKVTFFFLPGFPNKNYEKSKSPLCLQIDAVRNYEIKMLLIK